MCRATLLNTAHEREMMQAISVIIPMYESERYIRRCFDSLLNQTFTNWQAICVDDGSPDRSGEIAQEYAARDKRFVVIHQDNMGVSGARNTGLKYANGEYIMFLDADDSIHPQTMEMTYYMTRRDETDVVSYTFSKFYQSRLKMRHFFGLDTTDVKPFGLNHRYGPECVCSLVTNDIFKYATQKPKSMFSVNRQWTIEGCRVWKHLYRRSLISDIRFINGVLIEDFPWWSSVMLKNPHVTILNLPLYYYRPRFDGGVFSINRLRTIDNLCACIEHTFALYYNKSNQYQFQQWNKNFLWAFIDTAFAEVKNLNDSSDVNVARNRFTKLCKMGVLDFPPNGRMRKLRKEILIFIGM